MTDVAAPRRHILPPQTTALERAVDQTVPAWDWMAESCSPAALRRDAQFLPWLAVDWQVAQFAPYFDSVQALLAATLPWWLMRRGSPASVRAALAWLGFDKSALDEDGPWLHLDPGRMVSDADLRAVAHVVRASLPAQVRFYRVFHGWDMRPARTDAAARLDDGLLDDDSGVFVDVSPYGLPVKLSQGEGNIAAAAAPPAAGVQAAHARWHASTITYDDRPILDAWRLDSFVLIDSSGGATQLHTALSGAAALLPALWLLPAEVTSSACAWAAPAPRHARTLTASAIAARPHEDARVWSGGWDAQSWRPAFYSRYTETSQPED